MRSTTRITLLAAALLLANSTAVAAPQGQNWNQWRGPNRDGVGDAATLPTELPPELTRVWQVTVGEGHSSPVVVGDSVFLHSREDGQEVARALSLVDGSETWRQSYDAPYTMNSAARSHGPGPKSTAVVVDGRMFTFGITEILSAFDVSTGEVLWRHEFSDAFPETAPIYGSAMSPIVVGGSVVVHIGWDQAGAVVAFDAATGELRWSNDEFTPGYSSPIVASLAGTDVLVTQSDKHIIVLDTDSGATLWSMPFATDFQQNSVTPLVVGESLIFSGLDEAIFALALMPSRSGGDRAGSGAWQSSELWSNDRQPLYMSSPVLVGNRIFGMTHKRAGQFVCFDVGTGEPIWTSRGREGENAAIIALGDRIAWLTDEARLVITDANADDYAPLAEYEVADTPTWAHPVFTPRGVLIKDLETLALWSF